MLLQDVCLSALKIWWFSSSLSLRPPTPTPTPHLALNIVLLAWACASWSKASLLLQQRGWGSAEDERRVLACWHLVVAYGVVWGVNGVRIPDGGRKGFIPVLVGGTFVTVALDELMYLILSHTVLGPVVMTIRGYSPPPDAHDEDCVVCLGVGLNDENTTGAPTFGALQSFCKIHAHVAHIECMSKWFRMRRFGRRCPVCRRPLQVIVVDDRMLIRELGWWKGARKVIKVRWNWGIVLARAGVTIGCVMGVLAVVLARARWMKQRTKRL